MNSRCFMQTHGYLLFLIPPLLSLLLSHLLFELLSNSGVSPVQFVWNEILSQSTVSSEQVFTESRARYKWLSMALLDIVVPVIACIVAIQIIRDIATSMQKKMIIAVGGVLMAISLIHMLSGAAYQSALYEMVYRFTYQGLIASGQYSDAFLYRLQVILFIINTGSACVPILLLLAAVNTLAPGSDKQNQDPYFWVMRMKQLKQVIDIGSLYLVVGTLHMGMWLQWPVALVSENNSRELISAMAKSVAMYWGICFTLILFTIYVPAAYFLHHRARAVVIAEREALGDEDPDTWLENHHLSISLEKQVPQLLLILGPLLAEPITSVISGS